MKNTLIILSLVLVWSCNTAQKEPQETVVITEDTIKNDLESTSEVVEDSEKIALIQDYSEDLENLKNAYQKQLDTGMGMLQTSIEYSEKVDSMVIMLYNSLNKVEPKSNAAELADSQKKWFTARENAFQEEWKAGKDIEKETGVFPELEKMTAYGAAFDVSYEKALELNKRLNE